MMKNLMNYINNIKSNPNAIKKIIFISYIVLLHILYLFVFRITFRGNYGSKLFVYRFDFLKYLFATFETVVIGYYSFKKIGSKRLIDTTLLVIYLLYFLPGVLQLAVAKSPWLYMIFYFVFFIGIETWLIFIKPIKSLPFSKKIKVKNPIVYVNFLAILCTIIVTFLMFYTKKGFSISGLYQALTDVYGTRADANGELHWVILTFEYFASYLIMFLIAFYASKKKYISSVALLFLELCVFILQANRIVLFLSVVAFVVGALQIDSKKLILCFLAIMLVVFIEGVSMRDGGIVADIYRRYSVVPNKLSECYFDYFLTHESDYLRTNYNRIVQLLGINNPYDSVSIGSIIGEQYFEKGMNANTGLVGGGIFSFNVVAPIFTTFGIVFGLTLFDKAVNIERNNFAKISLSIVLATLIINAPTFLASIFDFTYLLLLFISFYPLANTSEFDWNMGELLWKN